MKTYISVFISVFFLYWLIKQFSLLNENHIVELLARMNAVWFVSGMAIMVTSAYAQSFRLVFMLRAKGKFKTSRAFGSVMVGHWLNIFLPVRLGDVARPWHFAKQHGLSFYMVLATTLVERVIDAGAVFFLLAGAAFILNKSFAFYALLGLILVYAGLIFFLSTLINKPLEQYGWLQQTDVKPRLKKIQQAAIKFITGLQLINTGYQWGGLMGSTIVVWVLNITGYWCLLKSCNLPGVLTQVKSAVVVASAAAVGYSVPSSANGLGIVNFTVAYALETLTMAQRVDFEALKPQILGASVMIYVALLIPDLVVGGIYYWRSRKLLKGVAFFAE